MSKEAECFGTAPRWQRYGISTEKRGMNKMMHLMKNNEQLMKHGMSMKKYRDMKIEVHMDKRVMRPVEQNKNAESSQQQDRKNDQAERNGAAACEQIHRLFGAAPVGCSLITLPFDEQQMQHGSIEKHDDEKTCPRTCLNFMDELPQSCPTEASLRHLALALNEGPMRIIGETSVHLNNLKKLRRMLLGGILPC